MGTINKPLEEVVSFAEVFPLHLREEIIIFAGCIALVGRLHLVVY